MRPTDPPLLGVNCTRRARRRGARAPIIAGDVMRAGVFIPATPDCPLPDASAVRHQTPGAAGGNVCCASRASRTSSA